MSRIGDLPILIPTGVGVEVHDQKVSVKGPLGELSTHLRPEITVETVGGELKVKRQRDDRVARSLHGLIRSLISNMIQGVTKGWERKLELVGVGYRAQSSGDKLTLNVGYSHPVEIVAPQGIKFSVSDNTKITVSGIDKSTVGQTAASIRGVKPPEPYRGKGIRFLGEYVRKKAGKAGKVGTGVK